MIIALIAAVADNGVIGQGNRLPWHIPEELQYFKAATLGKPVIMGRRTFESIGRPLPGRTNIVLTRDPGWSAEGVITTHTLMQAIQAASESAADGSLPAEAMVIGGGDLYARTLPLAKRLYLTEVRLRPAGDVYFPPFDRSQWQEVERRASVPAAGSDRPAYDVVVLEKR